MIIFQNLKYSHPPESDHSLTHQCINSTLKRKASEAINEQPWKLICKLTPKSLEILCAEDVVQFQKNLYKTRSKSHPTLTKMVSELHTTVSRYMMHMKADENFLLVNDADRNITRYWRVIIHPV